VNTVVYKSFIKYFQHHNWFEVNICYIISELVKETDKFHFCFVFIVSRGHVCLTDSNILSCIIPYDLLIIFAKF